MGRLAQFAGLQYSAAGDPKQAFAIFSRLIRDANMPGAKGYLFNGYRHISATLIQMGDIPQAEAFLRRNIALIEEARTSGLPGWRSRYPIVGQSWETDVEYNRLLCVRFRRHGPSLQPATK
jgi:tetratricopeptide (TPR) repeat protein